MYSFKNYLWYSHLGSWAQYSEKNDAMTSQEHSVQSIAYLLQCLIEWGYHTTEKPFLYYLCPPMCLPTLQVTEFLPNHQSHCLKRLTLQYQGQSSQGVRKCKLGSSLIKIFHNSLPCGVQIRRLSNTTQGSLSILNTDRVDPQHTGAISRGYDNQPGSETGPLLIFQDLWKFACHTQSYKQTS